MERRMERPKVSTNTADRLLCITRLKRTSSTSRPSYAGKRTKIFPAPLKSGAGAICS